MPATQREAANVAIASIDKPLNSLSKTDKAKANISPKVKKAIELMVEHGKRWEQAAVESGMTTRNMRLALERPHVLAYLRERKYVFRTAISAANIFALADIRDTSDNAMAKLGAIKVLEQIDGEATATPHRSTVAGFVINVTSSQPVQVTAHKTIDGELVSSSKEGPQLLKGGDETDPS